MSACAIFAVGCWCSLRDSGLCLATCLPFACDTTAECDDFNWQDCPDVVKQMLAQKELLAGQQAELGQRARRMLEVRRSFS